MRSQIETQSAQPSRKGLSRYLPRIGSPGYHILLACVAIFILGPLGGISASFMNFSIGFYVSGQVLAGILGSTVTFPYGPEGKHGGNYIQTMAAAVAGMCAMSVLIQAMVWLGLSEPPSWQIILYYLCIGMFGVGVGMLYTPLLVDRMQLTYPSGLAVANILRALTDPALLKRSVAKLGGSMLAGYAVGVPSLNLEWFSKVGVTPSAIQRLKDAGISASTLGAGMIVGARIAIPAMVMALVGLWQTPYLVRIGWLKPDESFRKSGFMIALGGILGAAVLDVSLLLIEAVRRFRQETKAASNASGAAQQATAPPSQDWKRVNTLRLVLWVLFWGAGIVVVGNMVLGQPVFYLTVAVLLCFVFVLVNGISQGITDWNPISSAFVTSVLVMAALKLHDPGVGLLCASILLIACSAGTDMQQDRSTGWRLGTNRIIQFRYQVIGIVMGAILAVVLAKVFMSAFPVLTRNQYSNPHIEGAEKWQSAMTYKMVGALESITKAKPHMLKALWLGMAIGLGIQILRRPAKAAAKLLPRFSLLIALLVIAFFSFYVCGALGHLWHVSALSLWLPGMVAVIALVIFVPEILWPDQPYAERARRAVDFILDAVLLPNPYASAFGGYVELPSVCWWTAGGIIGSFFELAQKARQRRSGQSAGSGELPADMSTMSLVGGGLIAGDALAALSVGIFRMVQNLF